MYYYIEKDGLPLYQLAASHPYGLALCLYTKKKRAQEICAGSATRPGQAPARGPL